MEENIWMSCVEIDSENGSKEEGLYMKHLMKRNVFIEGKISARLANNVMRQLLYLVGVSDEPINIFINSGGGEVNSGLLIYDMIQSIKSPINIFCTGTAGSMGAVLLAGGQVGRRFIMPHSKTMIHEPLVAGGLGGSATSIQTISNSILETKKLLNGILAKHTGKSIAKIDKATRFDNYMNAKESILFGLCDEIKNPLEICNTNKIN